MQRKFRRIQPLLNALPVLEAAARLESFTKAGEQLGLSQPTVSRHIFNLENHLGVPLFTRQHNKLIVTKQGKELAHAVDLGLSHIDAAVRRAEIEATTDGIRLASTQSFANCWLLPRFSELRRAAEGQPVHLLSSSWLDDIDLDTVDVVIHWRPQGWAGWPRVQLFNEVVFPVCSPDFANRTPELQYETVDPVQLQNLPLLHYEERATEFCRWTDWFRHFDCEYEVPDDTYRFSNYQFMLQAASDGEGVALAWQHLVADRIESGELKQIGSAFIRPEAGYYLEYRSGAKGAELQRRIIDWFIQKTNADPLSTSDKDG